MQQRSNRIAVLLSSPVPQEQRDRIQQGLAPRHDLLTLADRLNATLILPGKSGWGKGGVISRVRQMSSMAWAAFRRRKEYDLIITDLDAIGAALAFFFKVTRTKKRHMIICHGKLSRGLPAKLTRWLKLEKQVDAFVCYGPAVAERFVEDLKIPAEKVLRIKHPADHHFWKPTGQEPERLISSAGMTYRDYGTLVEAVRGLDVNVQLAAFSPWVNPNIKPPADGIPENVSFTRLPSDKLRDLYARSLFVVVPIKQTNSQAGSLVIYEAMAMGKAVIVTATNGEKALALVKEGETGLFFEPGDVAGLRSAIQRLLDNPDEARRMGAAGRAVVEQGLNLDEYVDDMIEVVNRILGEKATIIAKTA